MIKCNISKLPWPILLLPLAPPFLIPRPDEPASLDPDVPGNPGAEYFLRFLLMSDFLRLQVLFSFRILFPAASANFVKPAAAAAAAAPLEL